MAYSKPAPMQVGTGHTPNKRRLSLTQVLYISSF